MALCFAVPSLQARPLKDVYLGKFQIGAALGERYMVKPYSRNEEALRLLRREFNCVTAENLMKPSYLRPAPGEFNFDRSDEFVKLAKRMDLDVVGHVLVWHSQTPKWFFQDAEGQPISRDALIQRMRKHIHTIVNRYQGHIQYWDVVNEAVDVRRVVNEEEPFKPDGSTNYVNEAFFRESEWLNIIGEEFIELAFRFAHEADPKAELIYNDYSMTVKCKVDFVAERIVRPLKKKGVKIHAVGMQGHWHVDRPSVEEIDYAIQTLSDERVRVHITELDLDVLPRAYGYMGADVNTQFELRDELDPYRDGVPDEVLIRQAERYREIFDLFLKHKRTIERVTFWGISDGDSWKNDFPVRGRTSYPLLFDREYNPKPAYNALQ